MAAQHNYTITFKSLRAQTVYTLNIGGGTGNAIPLKGGAQPFVTQEDYDEDMFVPIRTQSGYLRVVDDGKDANGNTWDWNDLIPSTDTSRPVTLTRGGTVVWQGFMQAQDFGSVLYGNPQEREFPVQCVLSVLGGTDINYTQTAIQNFAYLLKQIVDAIPSSYRPTEFYIQGGANAQEWLLKRIDWQNFVSEDADGLTARFTMYQCLEDMCRFWGWTARTKSTTMYLTCADDSNQTTWLKLTYAELGQLAAYTSGTIPGDPSYTFETASLSGDIFASTNNDEYVQRGVKKATVSADGNSAEGTVMEAYPESVVKTMSANGTYTEQYTDCYAVYSQNIYEFSSVFLTADCPSTTNAAFCLMKVKKNINDGGQDYSVIRIADTNSGSNRLASFETVYHHSYYDNTVQNGGFDYGGILINFDIFRKGKRFEDYDSGGTGKKHIFLRVGIGVDRQHALWYNGSTWSSTAASISVRIGDQTQRTNMLAIHTNNVNMDGKLFVDFYGSSDMPVENSKRSFEIVGFSVAFNRRTYSFLFNRQEGVSSQKYVSKNNNNKTDNEFMTDCIYASGNNMLFGYGVVLEADGKWMGQLTYGSTQKWAEQHLADRVTNFWQTSRRRLAVELRRDLIADITPRHKVTIDGMTGYPIAISHEWRDDVTQLTILQL